MMTDTTRRNHEENGRIMSHSYREPKDGAGGGEISVALNAHYLHGPGVDEQLVWWSRDFTLSGWRGRNLEPRLYFKDGLGSVRAIAGAAGTDGEPVQAIVGTYTYDSFGNEIETCGRPALLNRYRYTGREDDYFGASYETTLYTTSTSLYYFRNRNYDQRLGTFIQTDPVWSLNQYTYSSNNPIDFIDPFGLDTIQVGFEISGQTIGFGGSWSVGIVWDNKWNVGVYSTELIGAAGATGGSGAVFIDATWTNAPDIYELGKGGSSEIGGSGAYGLALGGGVVTSGENIGGTFKLGVGGGGEGHALVGKTHIWGIRKTDINLEEPDFEETIPSTIEEFEEGVTGQPSFDQYIVP